MSDKCQTAMPLSEGGKHALGETDTQQHLGPCVWLFHVIEGAVDLALWGQDAHGWLSPAMLIWKHVIRADSTGTDQGEKLCKHADFRLGTKTTFFDIVVEKDVWRLCSLVAQVSVPTGPHSAFRWHVWMVMDSHILGTRPEEEKVTWAPFQNRSSVFLREENKQPLKRFFSQFWPS